MAAVAILGNTRFEGPPRFDGAGYAVLARSLLEGRGYRELEHPEAPPHAHYPPGYPIALAGLWALTGPSVPEAHAFAVACTLGATLVAWCWFRRLYPPRIALALGLALGANWAWARVGGSILSEPLYLLLGQSALLLAGRAGRRGGLGNGLALGLLLGACLLTRHIGAALALALGVDLLLRRRYATAWAAGLAVAVVVAPWAAWLGSVGHNTQVGILARGAWVGQVAGNALFYTRRLPDPLAGPFVERATVFGRSQGLAGLATFGAVVASAVLVLGWLRCLRTPRRRQAGLVPLTTLAVLLAWPFTEAGRFLIPIVPCLLVGAVEGLAALGSASGLRRTRAWAVGVLLAAGLPYSAYRIAADRAGAQERTQADFDAACAWIAGREAPAGPVLARQPGEVYWLTGRHALAPPADDPTAIDRAIERHGVGLVLVDGDRYARAPTSPLGRYIEARSDRVARVWAAPGGGGGAVAVYDVRPRGSDPLDPPQ